ncbi:hypothetical protein [Hymenobacter chitinivorans]|uniref:Uncharacterized protein n=1 Tax=Hymenobacter chitinivorans DSM 11115 TaxID=1121954 RepID=A0A2M9ASQ5_9BACT|nr:hypothetical protein [Hymenobacter chitinivorans]PJJ48730.1 hypothetical protein CLV45_4440 [Hymenobacter chitinivorans DSM 11115]
MADINIQRKKSSPSPWLLVLLVLVALGLLGYFLFRSDSTTPAEQPAPATTSATPVAPEADTTAQASPPPAEGTAAGGDAAAVADMAAEEAPATADELDTFARGEADSPDYGRRGLQMLTSSLSALADRADLRGDATVAERRNDLTSAMSRSSEPNASLRPGFVAVAGLLQAIQQKSYPDLEKPVAELGEQARALSGRTTAADQPALQAFFTKAATILQTLNEPTP